MVVRGLALVLTSLACLTACDLQPAKQREKPVGAVAPAPSPPPAEPTEPATPPPSPLPANAGFVDPSKPKPPPLQTTEECTTVAAHIAELAIGAIEDPAQRAVQEQDRTRMVRKLAELCTVNKWNDAARGCFNGAKTAAEVDACGVKYVQNQQPIPSE